MDLQRQKRHSVHGKQTSGEIEATKEWHLTPKERAVLTKAVAPYKGQKASIQSVDEPQSREFAEDLLEVLVKEGWDFGSKPMVSTANYEDAPAPIGVHLRISDKSEHVIFFRDATGALGGALFILDLMPPRAEFSDPSLPIETMVITVGKKP
jgi:hypothetical protein